MKLKWIFLLLAGLLLGTPPAFSQTEAAEKDGYATEYFAGGCFLLVE